MRDCKKTVTHIYMLIVWNLTNKQTKNCSICNAYEFAIVSALYLRHEYQLKLTQFARIALTFNYITIFIMSNNNLYLSVSVYSKMRQSMNPHVSCLHPGHRHRQLFDLFNRTSTA